MGKRSSFERRERDYYRTPREVTAKVMPFLPRDATYAEPCAGDGAIINMLATTSLYCRWASDIHPAASSAVNGEVPIQSRDFQDVGGLDLFQCGFVITNPPWEFDVVSQLVEQARLEWKLPIWLLLQADFAHNKRSGSLMAYCERIVSVGRVKWIPDSPHTGKDNCAWYLFNTLPVATTAFHARAA